MILPYLMHYIWFIYPTRRVRMHAIINNLSGDGLLCTMLTQYTQKGVLFGNTFQSWILNILDALNYSK